MHNILYSQKVQTKMSHKQNTANAQ